MKHLLYMILVGLLFCSSPVRAQEYPVERVYVHLDKDYYVAGESIRLKFRVVDGDCKPSQLSKVGYVEISDTERPYMQLKLALSDGSGVGKINIPDNIPSGIYELSAYTRYMRNEDRDVFFKKQITIINPRIWPDKAKAELVGPAEITQKDAVEPGVRITVDKNEYGNREKVSLSISGLPEDLLDLVVSVSGRDSMASSYPTDRYLLKRQIENSPKSLQTYRWIPEYEGHIITGRLEPKAKDVVLLSNLSFVGSDIKYINGQADPEGETVSFYTSGVYGPKEVVSSVTSLDGKTVPYRLDIVSPFSEDLPEKLPVLKFYPNEKQLMDRYVAAQLSRVIEIDTVTHVVDMDYYNFPATISYNLDEYTRFNTLGETMLEFVQWATIRKMGDTRRILVFSQEQQQFSKYSALVLLDGVPIFNHEEILEYNPRNIKTLDIYDGKYIFGNEVYEGIISYITHEKDLPFFKLNDEYQLFRYDCPELPIKFKAPDYSDGSAKQSRVPDMRHTLYWNPSVKPQPGGSAQLTFFTSDLCGEFKISIEGITPDGRLIQGHASFSVREK